MNNQMNNNSNIDANSIGNQTEVNMNQMGVNTNSNTRNSNNGINPVRSGANVSGIDKKRPLPKKIAEDKKYTENWIDIKTISNGIIYNKEGYMISGIRIHPKNIFISDRSSMDATLIGLMNFYNTIDFEFWLVVADRPVDISMYQAELQLLYNKTPDQKIRKLISQDMDKGDFFASNNVVDTEYYILFKEKKLEVLQKRLRSMINNISQAGISVNPTSTEELRMLVDNFLNGGRDFTAGGVMPL